MTGNKKREASKKKAPAKTGQECKAIKGAKKVETETRPRRRKNPRVDAQVVRPKGIPTAQRTWTPRQKARLKAEFLDELRTTCHIGISCAKLGVTRSTVQNWRQTDAEFAERWTDVTEHAIDDLEREARRRGLEGIPRPIIYQGMVTGSYTEYSDRLLEMLLKGRRAKVFAPRPDIGPTSSPEEFAQRLQLALKAMVTTDSPKPSEEGSYEDD